MKLIPLKYFAFAFTVGITPVLLNSGVVSAQVTFPSGSTITTDGEVYAPGELSPNQKREVENVFSIPIKKLILDKNQRVKNQKVNGKKAVVPYFHLNDQIVWGATSAILSELKLLILDIKWV